MTDKLRAFVTGDRGFIGTNLIRRLGDKIEIVKTAYSGSGRIDILKRTQIIMPENTDVIIHLASKTSILNSILDPYQTYLNNLLGTLNILDIAKEFNVSKIVNISTYVYGTPQYLPIDELHPLNPHSPYTKSKVLAETLCKYYSEDYKIDIVTIRPFYIYGPSQSEATFLPSIIKQINESRKVTLSNRDTKRDFLFINDFIDLVFKILLDFPHGYNVYNAGSGKSHSLEEIVEIISNIMNINIAIEYNPSIRPNDIVEMVADISLLDKLYGWKPQIDIESGLRFTLDKIAHEKID